MHCLYQVTNIVNGKYYIGVHQDTSNVAYLGSGSGIKRAVKKYGRENFRRDILAESDNKEFIYRLEAAVVNSEFVARQNNYNASVGGNIPPSWPKGKLRGPWLLERRQTFSLSRQGHQPLQLSHKGQKGTTGGFRKGCVPWNKGKTGVYSEETLQKMRTAMSRPRKQR